MFIVSTYLHSALLQDFCFAKLSEAISCYQYYLKHNHKVEMKYINQQGGQLPVVP